MFACFGKKTKKPKRKSSKDSNENNNSNSNSDEENQKNNEEKSKELNKELTKLKIKYEIIQYQNESYQRQSLFLDSLIKDYKMNMYHFDKDSNDINSNNSENKIESFIKNEYEILQAKNEMLISEDNTIKSQFTEMYNELDKLSNPQYSDKAKYETRKFLLENIILKKKGILDFLTNKINLLKKHKKTKEQKALTDFIFLNNNEQDALEAFNQNNNNNKQNNNSNSSDFSKSDNDNGYNNNNIPYYYDDPNRELIKRVLGENLEQSRASYQKVYKANLKENANFDQISKKIEEIKKEIDSIKNPQSTNAISTEAKSQNPKGDEIKENKEIKEKKEELQKNKAILTSLISEIDKTKNENATLEKDITDFYSQLSEKFSASIKLEHKLEKIRTKTNQQCS